MSGQGERPAWAPANWETLSAEERKMWERYAPGHAAAPPKATVRINVEIPGDLHRRVREAQAHDGSIWPVLIATLLELWLAGRPKP